MENNFTKESGIYCFENMVNGKKYIGQAQKLYVRIRIHLKQLSIGCDSSNVLQRAWDKYGEENFTVYIIEKCPIEILNEREIFWIKELHSHISEGGYNISWGGDAFMRGAKFTDEHKEKLRIASTGRRHTEEAKVLMSNASKGRKHSDETKKLISELLTGRIVTEETRMKLSIANKGQFVSDEQRNFLRIINTGKTYSEETKEKKSNSSNGIKRGVNPTSKYVGVSYDKTRNKWKANVTYRTKTIFLGRFSTEIEAAIAYNVKAFEIWGENAKLNIIEEEDNE
jgi:group I intron endonuclease